MRPFTQRIFVRVLAVALFAATVHCARAFSLLGVPDAWQVQAIGYQIDGSDVFGPMNLGEEYRWNSGVITYGFDPSFLDFFGQRGVEAVEQAVAIINALPTMSSLSADLSEFPLDTRRFNHQATALSILDIKSWALSTLLFEMGVGAPERWVFTLRARVVINNIPIYHTIKRNFDPVTLENSSYINGALYTYQIQQTYANPDVWEAVDLTVDPLSPTVTSVASLAGIDNGTLDFRGLFNVLVPGLFFTGLTRDDVGCLRYMYSKANGNVETLPPNTTIVASGGGPWGIPGGGTNAVVTNAVITALRPGIDKLNLVRLGFDSLVGQWAPITNRYQDTYFTNGAPRVQVAEQVFLGPDILFTAGDLGVAADGTPIAAGRTIAAGPAWQNNDAINGQFVLAGPGQIQTPIVISFSSVGPWFENVPEGTEENAVYGFVWGAYDGTTNAPVIFPNGTSIRAIEQQVFGASRGSPWNIP